MAANAKMPMQTSYYLLVRLTNVQTIVFVRGNICKSHEIGISSFRGEHELLSGSPIHDINKTNLAYVAVPKVKKDYYGNAVFVAVAAV